MYLVFKSNFLFCLPFFVSACIKHQTGVFGKIDQIENRPLERFCLSACPDNLLPSQHWLGGKVQFISFSLSVNNGDRRFQKEYKDMMSIPLILVHTSTRRSVPDVLSFLIQQHETGVGFCVLVIWCSQFPFVLFFCFSSLEDSVRFPHEQITI